MKNLLHIFKIFFIFALPIAAENLYENLNADQLRRLDYLSENIRCPKCSYGNINSSNAPISKDLMEERYGNYVILKTDINENTTLFLIPLMVLLISILLVTTYTIKRSR